MVERRAGDDQPDTSSGALDDVRRALVIGLGRSGGPACRALHAAGVQVVVADEAADIDVPEDLRDRVEVHLGAGDDELIALLDDVQLLVPSPGVPEHSPPVREALARGVAVWSEPELGWRLAPRRLVAVTGTNGKTTVTELTAAMLQSSGIDAVACGNIGHPFSAAALGADAEATLVAELSSFQLRFCHRLRPDVGVLLNLAPDHLDWHGGQEAYAQAKARMWQEQRTDDWAVASHDDAPAARLAEAHAVGRIAWASAECMPELGVGVSDGALIARLPGFDAHILDLDELPLAVPHHISNLAAAACAALLAGADIESVAQVARDRRPGSHRLQEVAVIDGVRFIDDSKATNPHAAAAALRAVRSASSPIVWIAGGLAKGIDLGVLASDLTGVEHAVFIGDAADRLAEVAAAADVPWTKAGSIEEAVHAAVEVAREGDTVLLAPACASFDQFRDYAERGERFAAAVGSLRRSEATPSG